MMKKLVIHLILWYQNSISPLFPSCCRFTPSCSHYALEAISLYGLRKGGWLASKRFLRCHPFHFDKTIIVDPVPLVNKKDEL